ncbi:hypothetical protein Tco_0178615 [Tanacetum coccineum]
MQDMLLGVLSIVLTLLGPMVINTSSLPIECRMTVNSSVLHSSSGLSMLRQAWIVTSPPSMPLKALSYNIFKNSSPISSLEFVIIGESICCLDSKTQYIVLTRRFDTSYPTGGYGVSVFLVSGSFVRFRMPRFWCWVSDVEVFGVVFLVPRGFLVSYRVYDVGFLVLGFRWVFILSGFSWSVSDGGFMLNVSDVEDLCRDNVTGDLGARFALHSFTSNVHGPSKLLGNGTRVVTMVAKDYGRNIEAIKNVVENESHFSFMGKGLLGSNDGSGGLIEGRLGERCSGNGGRGGFMSGVGEGKVNSMGGLGVNFGVSKRLLLEVSREMIGERGGIDVGEVGGGERG